MFLFVERRTYMYTYNLIDGIWVQASIITNEMYSFSGYRDMFTICSPSWIPTRPTFRQSSISTGNTGLVCFAAGVLLLESTDRLKYPQWMPTNTQSNNVNSYTGWWSGKNLKKKRPILLSNRISLLWAILEWVGYGIGVSVSDIERI